MTLGEQGIDDDPLIWKFVKYGVVDEDGHTVTGDEYRTEQERAIQFNLNKTAWKKYRSVHDD